MRSARTSRIRALVCEVSVTMPACEPVNEIALWPRSLIAISQSAQEMRSPVDSSMSISRGSGCGETSKAALISSPFSRPGADSTATTRLPASRWATIRRAARLIFSASATEVPPNFITTVGWAGTGLIARASVDIALEVTWSRLSVTMRANRRSESAASGERAPERQLVGVLEVGTDGQPRRQSRDRHLRCDPADAGGDVQRRRLARGGRVGGDHHLSHTTLA